MEFQIMNIKCEKCGCETAELIPTEYGTAAWCTNCSNITKINDIKKTVLVTCPYCQSTSTKKISGLSKAGSVALWGIFALGKTSKQWHCNNCKSDF